MTTVFRVFLPFALGYFLSYLFRTVNAVIAPDLVRDVGLNPSDLGLLTSVYFLSFAAFQLPLGILLDRFGPRRVEAVLLLFAALGAFLFARADSLSGLIVGRALIGLGVSACLMAAFKAFTLWLPSERLPLANGIQMISGGAGALAATTPVEAALALTDWRGVFTIVAGLTLFAALFIFLLVPEQKRSASGETLGQQLAGVGAIYSSRTFWRVAPWALTAQAGYLSIYGLWSGPWLRDVAGFDRMAVANSLMLVSVSMMLGYFVSGALADRLSRRNVRPMTVAVWGMGAFMLVELALTLQSARFAVPLWLMFGFFGASCILPYAVLSQSFPKTLSGRVNTSLNVLVFVAAFAAQWMIGVVIELWPQTASGGYHADGYRAGFAIVLVLQALAAVWFWFFRTGEKPSEQA